MMAVPPPSNKDGVSSEISLLLDMACDSRLLCVSLPPDFKVALHSLLFLLSGNDHSLSFPLNHFLDSVDESCINHSLIKDIGKLLHSAISLVIVSPLLPAIESLFKVSAHSNFEKVIDLLSILSLAPLVGQQYIHNLLIDDLQMMRISQLYLGLISDNHVSHLIKKRPHKLAIILLRGLYSFYSLITTVGYGKMSGILKIILFMAQIYLIIINLKYY